VSAESNADGGSTSPGAGPELEGGIGDDDDKAFWSGGDAAFVESTTTADRNKYAGVVSSEMEGDDITGNSGNADASGSNGVMVESTATADGINPSGSSSTSGGDEVNETVGTAFEEREDDDETGKLDNDSYGTTTGGGDDKETDNLSDSRVQLSSVAHIRELLGSIWMLELRYGSRKV